MAVPQVAIVGRPNVGKSSIFNWLSGRRLAIVDDMAGVTRDRVSQLIECEGRFVELTDTGGIGIEDTDNLTREVEAQISAAIDSADLLLFVVDTRSGITPLDDHVAERLRRVNKPVLCLANKTDDAKLDSQADEFHRLGGQELIKVSAHQNRNKDLLLEHMLALLPAADPDQVPAEPEMKIALVGRRNVGKSTFINTLIQSERMIVSEVPGTTRDSVDVRFEMDGKSFLAIDTPGLRKTKSVRSDLDFYSMQRAQRSIRRADVVLMLFDAAEPISQVDKHLCQYILQQYKPCVLVVNKWDLVVKQTPTSAWVDYLRQTFPTLWYVPIAFITGQTGKNMRALLSHAQMLYKQSLSRIGTSDLNRLVRQVLELHPPPLHKNRRPRVYYATQVGTQPPTIVLMCNMPQAFAPDYRRYLMGVLRDQLSFGEVPIKMFLHRRGADDYRDDVNV
ncbi:MAG: ribosome biogenesis GTPase Der [Planctomycetaceae bacterium]|nr:ribosome biogenesis GTPase Der [Planctomycetaceae bacterium]